MRRFLIIAGVSALGVALFGTLGASRAAAQDPILTPIIVSEAAPIIVSAITPKPKPGIQKIEGYIVHANTAQVTVRSKANGMALQTFSLNHETSEKMQKIVNNGGYQYGDKVTVYYDAQSHSAVKIKGKPSRPL